MKIEDFTVSTGFYPTSGQDVMYTLNDLVTAMESDETHTIAWNTLNIEVEREEDYLFVSGIPDERVTITLTAKAVVDE